MTKLETMLKYVSEHNDFYKKRIKEYGITNPLDIMISPMFLLEIIAQINNEMKDIIVEYQYSFMQSKKLLICNIQLAHGREKWFDSVNELILRYFAQKRAAGVTIDILVEHVYFVKDKKIKKRTLEFLE